jgi:hypothetical protein
VPDALTFYQRYLERRHCKAGRRKRRSLRKEIYRRKAGAPVRRSDLAAEL